MQCKAKRDGAKAKEWQWELHERFDTKEKQKRTDGEVLINKDNAEKMEGVAYFEELLNEENEKKRERGVNEPESAVGS